LDEGEDSLLSAVRHLRETDAAKVAELCFAIRLTAKMQGHDEERWERQFKFLIEQGFERCTWSCDRMLAQAEKVLPPDELEYAKALALAFLDESKVAALERYERWRMLEPLDPIRTERPT